MSQWTHVLGVLQTDPIAEEKVKEAFGVPEEQFNVNWKLVNTISPIYTESDWRVMGEGAVVTFEGDLRYFGGLDADVKQLVEWFLDGCKALNPRWATFSIEVEFGNSYLVDYQWGNYIIQKVDRSTSLTVDYLKAKE